MEWSILSSKSILPDVVTSLTLVSPGIAEIAAEVAEPKSSSARANSSSFRFKSYRILCQDNWIYCNKSFLTIGELEIFLIRSTAGRRRQNWLTKIVDLLRANDCAPWPRMKLLTILGSRRFERTRSWRRDGATKMTYSSALVNFSPHGWIRATYTWEANNVQALQPSFAGQIPWTTWLTDWQVNQQPE